MTQDQLVRILRATKPQPAHRIAVVLHRGAQVRAQCACGQTSPWCMTDLDARQVLTASHIRPLRGQE